MDEYLGVIKLFAGNYAPRNFALCNGQLLMISQYQALFAILGTFYGGNGIQNFALPDLRGRVPIHAGQGPGLSNYVLGQLAGVETVTLLTAQLPAHTHFASCNTSPGTQASPENAFWAQGPGGRGTPSPNQYASSSGATMAPTAISITGSNQAHENRQPYLVLNFIICINGIFPSRN